MPNIIGEFQFVMTSMPPLEAHIGHLRHLTNEKIARDLLNDVHGMTVAQAKDTARVLSPHIRQAINFYCESKTVTFSVRPVLQYYSYLNLAVAAILAYRPVNYNQYRKHGVEDRSHSLSKLDLSSEVLTIKRGAAPLFHSIFCDAPLQNKKFRFGQLAAGFHMCSHELNTRFNKQAHTYRVVDELRNVSGQWHSVYKFFVNDDGSKKKKVSKKRIEDAMPLLKTDYDCNNIASHLEYISKLSWANKNSANNAHRKNGIKFVNYGGHVVLDNINGVTSHYAWRGATHAPLLPTLTSILLLSFSLASIVRYRPLLLDTSLNSPILLIIDTFVSEADSVFIPSLRNLLYKEEVAIGYNNYI